MAMRLDAHVHIHRLGFDGSKEVAKWYEGGEPGGYDRDRNWEECQFHTPYERILRDMDEAGVDKAVLVGILMVSPSHPEFG